MQMTRVFYQIGYICGQASNNFLKKNEHQADLQTF